MVIGEYSRVICMVKDWMLGYLIEGNCEHSIFHSAKKCTVQQVG